MEKKEYEVQVKTKVVDELLRKNHNTVVKYESSIMTKEEKEILKESSKELDKNLEYVWRIQTELVDLLKKDKALLSKLMQD